MPGCTKDNTTIYAIACGVWEYRGKKGNVEAYSVSAAIDDEERRS